MTAPFIGTCDLCKEEGVVTSISVNTPKDIPFFVTICLTCVKEIFQELESYDRELNYGMRVVGTLP